MYNTHCIRIRKFITILVLVCFTWFTIGPWRYTIAADITTDQTSASQSKNLLIDLEVLLKKLQEQVANSEDISARLSDLANLRLSLQAESTKILQDFSNQEEVIKLLSAEVVQRQQDAVDKYNRENEQLNNHLDNIEALAKAADRDALNTEIGSTLDFLGQLKLAEPPLGNTAQKLPFELSRHPGEHAELLSKFPKPSLASDAPTGDDLRETKAVVFSQGIQDLAASLDHNPLKIFNWVRKNILFAPGFGSIQGSEGCRLSKECNGADTASLLLALLRVSGISARYVSGVVNLDAGAFKSVMGDFQTIEAAVRMAGKSGIPVALSADKTQVRIRHIWVEAFLPHPVLRKNVWIPLEGALKYTKFKSPLDLEKELSTNMKDVITELTQTATVGADGSITGLDEALMIQRFGEIKGDIGRLLDQPEYRHINVGDVLGALRNKESLNSPLFPTNPWMICDNSGSIVSIDLRQSDLPTVYHHRMNLQITDVLGTVKSVEVNWLSAELSTHRLTIGYLPATQTDVDIIKAFGGFYDTPPYLLNLKPVVYLDGNAVTTGPAIPMGQFQRVRVTFNEPSGFTDTLDHFIRSGTYAVVGLDFQHVSSDALGQRADLFKTTAVEGLGTKDLHWDDVLGETLQGQSQSFFSLTEGFNRRASNRLNVRAEKRISEMLMAFAPAFAFAGSVPVKVTNLGMNMDHRRNIIAVASRSGNDADEFAYFTAAIVFASGFEHGIFEIFSQSQSVSTVKLMAEANRHNIPIYAIDQTNIAAILPKLQLPQATIQDIQSHVNAGNWVFAPKQIQNFFNWSGVGYVVINPINGTGGYLISGGLAGGSSAQPTDLLTSIGDSARNLTYKGIGADEFVEILEASNADKWATKLAKWTPYIGDGISAVTAYENVLSATGDPVRALAAEAADFVIGAAFDAVMLDLIVADIVAAVGTGGVALVALPFLLAAWVGGNIVVDNIKKQVIEQIAGQPITLLNQRRKRGMFMLAMA